MDSYDNAAAASLDSEVVAALCRQYGVRRLALFGSATTDRFDPAHSDFDIVVDYLDDAPRTFDSYFDLKTELEELAGRAVDLVVGSAIVNPYFARSVAATSQDLYAA